MVNARGKSGGLAFLWFDEIDLEIINFSESHIHTKIRENSIRVECYLTGFYGAPEIGKWTESWNLFENINPGVQSK